MKDPHIVVFRRHGALNCETQHIGPFDGQDAAYEALCAMPALGPCPPDQNSGVKYVQQLAPCLDFRDASFFKYPSLLEQVITMELLETIMAYPALPNGAQLAVAINDGQEWVCGPIRSIPTILTKMGTTDHDVIAVHDSVAGGRIGTFTLIWGNGRDVISDGWVSGTYPGAGLIMGAIETAIDAFADQQPEA